MWVGILAAESALFNWYVIFSASLRSLGGAPALQGSKIRRSVSDGPLDISGYSAAMNLSNRLPLFEVGTSATKIVFPFRRTVIFFCTRSVLAPDTTTVVMVGRSSGCMYVREGYGVWGTLWECGVVFLTACCLWLCLCTAASVTSGSKISGSCVAIIEVVYVGAAFATTMLRTSVVTFATSL